MLPVLRAMTKPARCAEEELEPKAGKTKKLNSNHDIFAAIFVQAQAQTSNTEQEEDAPGEEAQAVQAQVQRTGEQEEYFEEDAAGEEVYLEYSEPGIDDAASAEDVQYEERSSENMYAENSSEVAADEGEQYDNYSFQCQDDLNSSRSPPSSLAPRKLTRIADLHPCLTGHWQTRGRVAHKSSVRPYKNRKGAGIVFSFEMADEHGDEIRVVCFNDQVKKFFDKVREGEWIVVSKGLLQAPNRGFNWDKRACEVVLVWNSSIERGDSTVVKGTTEGSRIAALEDLVESLRRKVESQRREAESQRREGAQLRRELRSRPVQSDA